MRITPPNININFNINMPHEATGIEEERLGRLAESRVCARERPSTSEPTHGSTESQALLGELKNYWTQLKDPLDTRIMSILEKLCELSHDTKNELMTKYVFLIKNTGEDSIDLVDNLQEAAMGGTTVLLRMIKIAITSYLTAMTRNAQAGQALISFASVDAKFKQVAEDLNNQKKDWTSLSQSMTKYMSEIERRTLNLQKIPIPRYTQPGTPLNDSKHDAYKIVSKKL